MKYIILLENEKGKKNWFETSDLKVWNNPVVGKLIFVENKKWIVKGIIPKHIEIF